MSQKILKGDRLKHHVLVRELCPPELDVFGEPRVETEKIARQWGPKIVSKLKDGRV
jgi:hypothetical protein